MSKTKTHKGAAKRFKVTGTGKIKHRSPKLSKKLMKKSSSRKRRLRKEKVLSKADEKVVRKKLGI
ncbi:MAG: 50S ribosomal protein L35 [Actinomycetia bacterium]|nr:50S ribosomal protein L35 [Actinomycetes bacterium]